MDIIQNEANDLDLLETYKSVCPVHIFEAFNQKYTPGVTIRNTQIVTWISKIEK